MVNSSVLSLLALLLAALLIKTLTAPAHAREVVSNIAVLHSVDQTVYRPNCPGVEYDQRCLFDGCAPDCDRR